MTNLETDQTSLPPPTPHPTQLVERRWARSDERIVLGVAGGLARALAIEPLLVRIGFVVMALFSGVGILLYVAALLLLADSPTSPPPSLLRRIIGSIAVVVAARWLFGGDAHLPAAGWVVAIGLLGIAAALWRGRDPASATVPPPAIDVQTADDGGSTTDRWASWTAQRRDRPRPPRSVLGLLTIGAATVVGALVWLFNDGAGNRGTLAFGWATVVIGAGLLVGTVAGRARWLILPALATAAAAVLAAGMSFAGVGLANRAGSRSLYFDPGTVPGGEYRTGVGDVELWLADYPNDVSTSVEVGAGDITIVVPDAAHVQVDARVGIGTIDALGSSSSGYRRTLTLDTKSGGTLINLRLRVGAGSIEVRRASSAGGAFPVVPTPYPFAPTTISMLPGAPPLADIPVRQTFGDGTVVYADGSIDFGDGSRVEADGTFQGVIVQQLVDGTVQLDNGALIHPDGSVTSPGGFAIPHLGARPLVGTPTSLGVPVLPSPGSTTVPVATPSEVQP